MSVEPEDLMIEVWARWQGHVVNGVFPLGRCLGCSDHSGVFLTRSEALGSADVAIKLIPTDRAQAELQLPRWKRAASLTHPHLLSLLQWGGCQLDGQPYLYLVMEYADQTLAQLLRHRALSDDETREMMQPVLEALAFLHERNLVHGQLKPANVLVVGDQLKLASDSILRIGNGSTATDGTTPNGSPEALRGSNSTAGDISGLGLILFEALTRRSPYGISESREGVALPSDFSPAFREVVTRCLSRFPEDRPSIVDVAAWARGESLPPAPAVTLAPVEIIELDPSVGAPVQPATPAPSATPPAAASTTDPPVAITPLDPSGGEQLQSPTPAPPPVGTASASATVAPVAVTAPEPRVREQQQPGATPPAAAVTAASAAVEPVATVSPEPIVRGPAPSSTKSRPAATKRAPPSPLVARILGPRALPLGILGAVGILALGWVAIATMHSHGTAIPAREDSAQQRAPASATAPIDQAPVPASSATTSARGTAAGSSTALHQVIPDVPWSARRTIRGHIDVWIRVIVDQDGSVFAATADRAGPSRYFQRLAIDSAKKWTFPPADTPSQRLMQVRFDFSRDGTSGRAVALR